MVIYGTDLCKDCVACKADQDRAGVSYEYRDITANLLFLKEFLTLRDTEPVFEEAKSERWIGIPAILRADGKLTLSWEDLI